MLKISKEFALKLMYGMKEGRVRKLEFPENKLCARTSQPRRKTALKHFHAQMAAMIVTTPSSLYVPI